MTFTDSAKILQRGVFGAESMKVLLGRVSDLVENSLYVNIAVFVAGFCLK